MFYYYLLIFDCKYPVEFNPLDFNIFPFLFIITEIPEFADLTRGTPFSTDLNIVAARCCEGPVVLPNHASLVILIKIFILLKLNV